MVRRLDTIQSNNEASQRVKDARFLKVLGVDVCANGNIVISTSATMKNTKWNGVIAKLRRYCRLWEFTVIAIEDHQYSSEIFRTQHRRLIRVNDLIERRLGREFVVIKVDPFKSSITCSRCKMVDKESRISSRSFLCTTCCLSMHADLNAAINIKQTAEQIIHGSRIA